MKCAAIEIVHEVNTNRGNSRKVVKTLGEIRKPAYFETMAAYRPQTSQQWHLEQWFPLKAGWYSAEIQYRLSCRKNLAEAMRMVKAAPKLFRVVFRDEYVAEETVVDAKQCLVGVVGKLGKSGPRILTSELEKFLPEEKEKSVSRAKRKRELNPIPCAANSRNTGLPIYNGEGALERSAPMAYVDGVFFKG